MAIGTQLEKSPAAASGQLQRGGRWAGLWGLARVRWAQMAPAQRGWVVVAAFLLVALVGGLAWYAMRPGLAHAVRRSGAGRCAPDGPDSGSGADSV